MRMRLEDRCKLHQLKLKKYVMTLKRFEMRVSNLERILWLRSKNFVRRRKLRLEKFVKQLQEYQRVVRVLALRPTYQKLRNWNKRRSNLKKLVKNLRKIIKLKERN